MVRHASRVPPGEVVGYVALPVMHGNGLVGKLDATAVSALAAWRGLARA